MTRLPVEVETLPNGIRVVSVPVSHFESTTLGVWVGVGGRDEPLKWNGICHFIEHLLFKGTRSRTAREISQAVEGRGGYCNAFTQEELTCYYACVPGEYADSVLEILADMYHSPRFHPDDLNRERLVILEEIASYEDQPAHYVEELLAGLLWPKHPLGRPLTGTAETIRKINRRDLIEFKRRFYQTDNTSVVIVGQTSHEHNVRLCQRWWPTSRPAQRVRRPRPTIPPPAFFVARQKDVEQTNVAIGFRAFGRHDRRRFALKLASVVLGENTSSRLFQTVREQHGLAYSIHSHVGFFADTGYLSIVAGVDTERTERAIQLILAEVRRLTRSRIGRKELQRAKEYVVGQMKISLESMYQQFLWVGDHLLGYSRIIQPEEYVARVNAVTPEQIMSVVRSTLAHPCFALIAPFPLAESERIYQTCLKTYSA